MILEFLLNMSAEVLAGLLTALLGLVGVSLAALALYVHDRRYKPKQQPPHAWQQQEANYWNF